VGVEVEGSITGGTKQYWGVVHKGKSYSVEASYIPKDPSKEQRKTDNASIRRTSYIINCCHWLAFRAKTSFESHHPVHSSCPQWPAQQQLERERASAPSSTCV